MLFFAQNCNAINYDKLEEMLSANFPETFEGKQIHPKTYKLGKAIIKQISEDLRHVEFAPEHARWLPVTDYILYDANSQKTIGNTCNLVFKSSDDKIIGTYLMNTENPVNNRILYTSYKISNGSYTIKEKIHRDIFSTIICKEPQPKLIQRF